MKIPQFGSNVLFTKRKDEYGHHDNSTSLVNPFDRISNIPDGLKRLSEAVIGRDEMPVVMHACSDGSETRSFQSHLMDQLSKKRHIVGDDTTDGNMRILSSQININYPINGHDISESRIQDARSGKINLMETDRSELDWNPALRFLKRSLKATKEFMMPHPELDIAPPNSLEVASSLRTHTIEEPFKGGAHFSVKDVRALADKDFPSVPTAFTLRNMWYQLSEQERKDVLEKVGDGLRPGSLLSVSIGDIKPFPFNPGRALIPTSELRNKGFKPLDPKYEDIWVKQ